jgi:hypothetical protein
MASTTTVGGQREDVVRQLSVASVIRPAALRHATHQRGAHAPPRSPRDGFNGGSRSQSQSSQGQYAKREGCAAPNSVLKTCEVEPVHSFTIINEHECDVLGACEKAYVPVL